MIAAAEQEQLSFFQAKASRYALYGVIIAAASVGLATLLVSYVMDGSVSLNGIIGGQRHNIALRVLDAMPFMFAAWGQYAGRNMAQAANRLVRNRTLGLNRALQAATTTSQAKSDFFSKISHELRTPINGILGTSELMAGTALSDEQRRYVRLIESSAQSLLNVLNDLLDFSKIEAGRLHLEEIPFDLKECIEGPVMLLRQQAQLKAVSLEASIERRLSTPFLGDPGRLRQVLMNLVGNAVKFTHQGSITVTAQVVRETATTVAVRLAVQDTGIGIAPSAQRRLFQPYAQAKASTAREYGGSGLGLAISKELVEAMGGRIGLDSREGHGSTFWCEIPFKKAVPADAPTATQTLQGLRALIVDPRALSESWMAAHLSGLGLEVEQTMDAESAKQRLAQAAAQGQPFDLALLDMFLPGSSGETLGQEIKATAGLERTILIMLTSAGQRGDARRAKEIGFSAYLTRPLTRRLLTSAVTEAVGRRNEAQDAPELITKYSLGAQSPRILFVEDSAINREIALHALAPHGYLIDFACNGKEGIEAAGRRRYDLLLVDLQMPVIDGLRATQAIRTLPNAASQGPVVILTAGTTDEVRAQCLAAGALDVIIKPPGADALVAVVERFVQPARLETPVRLEAAANDASVREAAAAPGAHPTPDKVLARIFLKEAESRIETLGNALRRHTQTDVVRQAHTLKGTSRHFQADTFSELAARIEALAQDAQLAEAEALLPALKQEFAALRTRLSERA